MIKKARIRKGLKQKDISLCTGLSQGYLSQLEKNNPSHSPTITQIVKLSIILEVNPKDLAGYFIEKEIDLFDKDSSKLLIENRTTALMDLKKLLNKGLITRDQFNIKRNKLLDIN